MVGVEFGKRLPPAAAAAAEAGVVKGAVRAGEVGRRRKQTVSKHLLCMGSGSATTGASKRGPI
jgi:hypothetical protein